MGAGGHDPQPLSCYLKYCMLYANQYKFLTSYKEFTWVVTAKVICYESCSYCWKHHNWSRSISDVSWFDLPSPDDKQWYIVSMKPKDFTIKSWKYHAVFFCLLTIENMCLLSCSWLSECHYRSNAVTWLIKEWSKSRSLVRHPMMGCDSIVLITLLILLINEWLYVFPI